MIHHYRNMAYFPLSGWTVELSIGNAGMHLESYFDTQLLRIPTLHTVMQTRVCIITYNVVGIALAER